MRPLRRFDVTGLRSVDGREHSHLVAGQVFVAVRDDDRTAVHHDASVDGALRGDEAPYLLSGLWLDGVDAAVAEADDQQSSTVYRGDVRSGVRRVVRAAARIRHIHDVARTLVERDDAMRACRLRAPVRHGRADDDEIAVDDWGHRPAAVGREGGELFAD